MKDVKGKVLYLVGLELIEKEKMIAQHVIDRHGEVCPMLFNQLFIQEWLNWVILN